MKLTTYFRLGGYMKKIIRQINSGTDYWKWIENHAPQNEDGTFREDPLANPDVLPAPAHEPSDAEIVIREWLDDPKKRLAVLSPAEELVFCLRFVDGKTEREVAATLGKDRKEVQRIVARVRDILARQIKRREAGL